MRAEELRDLFSLRQHTLSDTFDSMCGDDEAEAGDGGAVCAEVHKAQVGHDHESQAHTGCRALHIYIMRRCLARTSSCLWTAGCFHSRGCFP